VQKGDYWVEERDHSRRREGEQERADGGGGVNLIINIINMYENVIMKPIILYN
jgi:hypothetical protein